MNPTAPDPGWQDLLARWDAQQGVYVEGRERGYEAMLSVLDALAPDGGPVVVDLAAGPGSISRRVLEHRADARAVAVDVDPVLQTIGRGALGDMGGRLRWVTADLRETGWLAALGEDRVDAVLSSTALHWLERPALAALYAALAGILRPGGVLLNFDGFERTDPGSAIAETVRAVDRARQERALAAGTPGWQDWWDEARAVPALEAAFAARDRVFAPARGRVFADSAGAKRTTRADHAAALREAGFREVDTVWQDFTKAILLAVR